MKLLHLASLSLVVVAQQALAQAPTWLCLPATTPYTLVEKDGAFTARIPITAQADGPDAAGCTVHIADVLSPDGRSEDLSSVFSAAVEKADLGHGAALVIRTSRPLEKPGTYQVVLQILGPPSGDPSKGARSVTLPLQCLAAEIDAVPAVHIGQIRGPCSGLDQPGVLLIQEKTGKASLRNLRFAVIPDLTEPPPPARPTLEITGAPALIAPGQSGEAVVLPKGVFPLGKSTGKIEIFSDPSAAPILVAYEVRTRLAFYWIALTAALGAVAGHFVRSYLKNAQERDAALVGASTCLESLNDSIGTARDPAYSGPLIEAAEALKTVADDPSSAAAKIDEAVKKATDARTDLLAKMEADRTQLLALLKTVQDAFATAGTLPAEVHASLLKAKSSIEAVAAKASSQRYKEGLDSLDHTLTAGPCHALLGHLQSWRGAVGSYLDHLKLYPPPLPAGGSGQLTTAVASWTQSCPTTAVPAGANAADTLAAGLFDAARAFKGADDIAVYLSTSTRDFVESLYEHLSATPQSPENDLKRAGQASQDASDHVRIDINRAPPGVAVLAERARHLRAVWRRDLGSRLSEAADTANFEKLIEANNWSDALDVVVAAHRKPQPVTRVTGPGTGSELYVTQTPGGKPSLTAAPFSFSLVGSLAGAFAGFRIAAAAPLEGTPAERVRLANEGERARILQTAIISVLFILIIYAVYTDRWCGSFGDFTVVFFAAYLFDFTSDALVNAAKKLVTFI